MTDPTVPVTPHPLLRAMGLMARDLASTLVFVAMYQAFPHRIGLAVGAGIAIGLAEIGWETARRRPVHRMQWLSLFLVVTFGGATLLTGNPVFAMLKPALIYGAVCVVLLSPGWMNLYAPTTVRGVDLTGINRTFGFIWAALFGGIAAAALALALLASPAALAWFLLVVPLAAKASLIVVQYAATRRMVRRHLAAQREAARPGA
jgi:TM2 domain-containing membrane protein YozV